MGSGQERKLTKREKNQSSRERSTEQKPNAQKVAENKISKHFLWLIPVFCFILYGNSLKNGYVLDDFSVIKDNFLTTRGTDAIPDLMKTSYRYGYLSVNDGLYRPLSMVTFAIEWQLFGENTRMGHLINVLLYVLCGFVLYRVLDRVEGWKNTFKPGLVVLLFLAHPLHTEVVGNIKSRDEILCFLFCFLSIWEGIKYVDKQGVLNLFLSFVYSLLAMFSKESSILLLGYFVLITYWIQGKKINRQLPVAAMILLASLIYLAARNSVLDSVKGIQAVSSVDNPLSGIDEPGAKLFTGCYLLARYFFQLILPYPLIYDYSFNSIPVIKTANIQGIASVLGLLALLFFGIKFWLKRNWLGFSLLFFVGSLLLFSNIFILIGALYAERFAFFAVLPFSLVLMEGLMALKEKTGATIFTISASVILLIYAALTIQRNPDWKNNETLYRHDLALQPNSAKTHYYLGNELIKSVAPNESDSEKKIQLFNEAIAHLNDAVSIYPNYPDGYTQIGVGYYKMNQFDKAGGFFEKALSIDPYSKVALNNLASIRFNQNRIEDALKTYQRVLAIDPNFVDAWLNLGSCYGMLKNYPKAIESFERCLALAPNNEKACRFMSMTYGFMGDKARADEYLKRADSLK